MVFREEKSIWYSLISKAHLDILPDILVYALCVGVEYLSEH